MSAVAKITGLLLLSVTLLAAATGRRTGTTPLLLSYPAYFGNRIYQPADNPLTKEGVQLGRMLFYEKALSANHTIACAGCHKQEKAFADDRQFSAGFDGVATERNAMALVNLLWVRNYFWDGRTNSLEKQAAVPLTHPHEMGQTINAAVAALQRTKVYPAAFQKAFGSDTITGDRITKALAQFERTLISCNAPYDKYLRGEYKPLASETNGMELFFTNPNPERQVRGAGCGQCHGGPKTFIELFHNNGLDSMPADAGREKITGFDADKGRFRVVTLRNIALTAPYMHDGRFATLEQVIDHYSDHIQQSGTLSPFLRTNSNNINGSKLQLTIQEKKDLLAFLQMLTDSSFITNPQFADPFIKNKKVF
ncbi:MAG: cytochrome c peroxidase [Chitinophagaceae bacterium]